MALFHSFQYGDGLGWVDFVWGADGVVKPSGKTRGAMGISHIREARQRKDGLSDAQVVDLLEGIVDAIASGTEFSRAELESATRVGVERGDKVVWLTKQKGSNAWVVTAYEKNPDGANAGRATSAPTSPAASRTRDQRVAGFAEIMGLNDPDVKHSADGRMQGFFDPITQKAYLVADNLTPEDAPGVLMHGSWFFARFCAVICCGHAHGVQRGRERTFNGNVTGVHIGPHMGFR